MIPRNHQNTKVQVFRACPNCGMDLTDRASGSFTRDNETFCCQGCAQGTGCTCVRVTVRTPQSRGAIEQREPGVLRGHVQGSGEKPKTAAPLRHPTRKASTGPAPKRKRSVTKQRDSTRQQARGQSEFTGSLNKGGATRVSRTGTKSAQG